MWIVIVKISVTSPIRVNLFKTNRWRLLFNQHIFVSNTHSSFILFQLFSFQINVFIHTRQCISYSAANGWAAPLNWWFCTNLTLPRSRLLRMSCRFIRFFLNLLATLFQRSVCEWYFIVPSTSSPSLFSSSSDEFFAQSSSISTNGTSPRVEQSCVNDCLLEAYCLPVPTFVK